MYVPYQCCNKSFEDYYSHQAGSGLNYYQGTTLQKGYGFGGLFRSLFRAAVPLFKSGARAAAPLIKSGAKAVGKQLIRSGVDVINDMSQGESLKVAAKRRFKEAGNSLAHKAGEKVKTMVGAGNKKRKRSSKTIIRRRAKKVKTRDIFD